MAGRKRGKQSGRNRALMQSLVARHSEGGNDGKWWREMENTGSTLVVLKALASPPTGHQEPVVGGHQQPVVGGHQQPVVGGHQQPVTATVAPEGNRLLLSACMLALHANASKFWSSECLLRWP